LAVGSGRTRSIMSSQSRILQYLAAFPERGRARVTADVASLGEAGFPAGLIEAWAGAIPSLNALQIEAINDFGVLDGEHIVVSGPTSSGKTLIGELAALQHVLAHRHALFLLPLKALVADKRRQFEKVASGQLRRPARRMTSRRCSVGAMT
jgi:helicase